MTAIDFQARKLIVDALSDLIGVENIYDSRPMYDVPYPFADVNNSQFNSIPTTTQFVHQIVINVDIFDTDLQRCSSIAEQLIQKLIDSNNLSLNSLNNEQYTDNSTNEILYHARLKLPILI